MLEEYIRNRIADAYEYMQNDTDKALNIFDDVLEIEPDNIEALNGKGSSLMKLNRPDEAINLFNLSLSICENSSALLNKGIIFKQKKDFENALIFYDRACQINPDLENIINILKQEIADVCNETDLCRFSDEATELIKQADEFKSQNKLWDSLNSYSKAIEADPSCEEYVSEQIDDIKTVFKNEFMYNDRKFDENSKIDRLKMQALRADMKDNNPQKALTLMNLVLELDENDINTLNHKGGALFISGEYEKAIECFDECLKMDEDYSYALFNKALALRIMNKLPEALECFDELLKTPQNHNKVKPYQLEILEKLQKEVET